MTPMTPERRAEIQRQLDTRWKYSSLDVADMLRELLADSDFWREAVKNADAPSCPFCRADVTIDLFWRDRPDAHSSPDCPWLLASKEG